MAHPGQCLGCLSLCFILLTVIFGMVACWSKEWYVIETDQESDFKTVSLGLMLICRDQTCDFYTNNNNIQKIADWSAGKCDNKAADLQTEFDNMFTLALLAAIFFFVGFCLTIWSQMRYHWKPLILAALFILLGWIFAIVITVGWLNYVNGTLFCAETGTSSSGTSYTAGDFCNVRDHKGTGKECTNGFGFSIVMGLITAICGFFALFLVVSTASFRAKALSKLAEYRAAIAAENGDASKVTNVDEEIKELYEDEEWEKQEAEREREEIAERKRQKEERLAREKEQGRDAV